MYVDTTDTIHPFTNLRHGKQTVGAKQGFFFFSKKPKFGRFLVYDDYKTMSSKEEYVQRKKEKN